MNDDPKKLYDLARGAATLDAPSAMVHVRVQGRSRDIAIDLLGIDSHSPDESICAAVAVFMEMNPEQFRNTVVERHANGNLTVRPTAVFG
jgi:hypothetical protein